MSFQTYLKNCLRVFKVTKKPSPGDYKQIVKLTGMGIAIMGVTALIVTVFFNILGV